MYIPSHRTFYNEHLLTLALQASRSIGALQLLPRTVCAELRSELDIVASDEN